MGTRKTRSMERIRLVQQGWADGRSVEKKSGSKRQTTKRWDAAHLVDKGALKNGVGNGSTRRKADVSAGDHAEIRQVLAEGNGTTRREDFRYWRCRQWRN